MFIDAHVHFRDGDSYYPESDQSYKETLKHGLMVAERAGFTAVFDMPNFNPPATTKRIVEHRIDKANALRSNVKYYLYGGVTKDPDQIRNIVNTWRELKQCVALKEFCEHSTGNLGIIDEEDQHIVMETLTKEKYFGVLVQHLEMHEFNTNYFDPNNPLSHAFARPFYSETEALKRQLEIADDVGFEGKLHVAHISVPETAQIVYEESQRGRKITSGTCPHYILFDMYDLQEEQGILLKMNPPLRPKGMNKEILEMLKDGRITWLETDHAPHTLEEKTQGPHPSGIPGIHIYPLMIHWLRKKGFSEERIREITFTKVNETFNLGLEPRLCEPELNLFSEYGSDPYGKLGVFDKK